MSNTILIKTVRIHGFRGLKNIEVQLEKTTVLTGMNNVGKTSFLKALQISLGNRQFLSQDDFYVEDNTSLENILVDIMIVPIDENGEQANEFSENWEILFTTDRLKFLTDLQMMVPLRTVVTFDPLRGGYTTKQYILENWTELSWEEDGENKFWYESDHGQEKSFRFDELPFFYMDAQRDILEDLKAKKSYLGKMISKIEYSPEAIAAIEEQIRLLNETAVSDSAILTSIKTTLKELDSAIGTHGESIEITPFTKKLRDLNKGLTIYYGDDHDSFSMEYHGMGTRSWSSLLTLKSFIELLRVTAETEEEAFFPILAIEEPEAHLHPNAQKKLYSQIDSITGQKIISTHSPYIAATAKINEIRNFYKNDIVECGQVNVDELSPEDIRKINRQVINTRGEIFFSKCLVLFEGETEEQALPIFFDKYFGKTPVELGVDFVGVSGHGNYLPFIRFAEYLKIPWLIFSDNDKNGKIKESVLKQFTKSGTEKLEENCIIFLDNECDFEQELINDGFANEIKNAFISLVDLDIPTSKEAKIVEINAYDNEKLYKVMTKQKTLFAPVGAISIVEADKPLPSKVSILFEKIKIILTIEEPE